MDWILPNSRRRFRKIFQRALDKEAKKILAEVKRRVPMAAEDYHDMSQLDDIDFIVQHSCIRDDGGTPNRKCYACEEEKQMAKIKMAKKAGSKDKRERFKLNKFYVGAESALTRNWGWSTLDRAMQHGKEIMDSEDREEVFIVQIVRVLRRRKSPIEVEVVR